MACGNPFVVGQSSSLAPALCGAGGCERFVVLRIKRSPHRHGQAMRSLWTENGCQGLSKALLRVPGNVGDWFITPAVACRVWNERKSFYLSLPLCFTNPRIRSLRGILEFTNPFGRAWRVPGHCLLAVKLYLTSIRFVFIRQRKSTDFLLYLNIYSFYLHNHIFRMVLLGETMIFV